mmetsp:Transcript_10923/g.15619  ORF Transcript_10923/g.15619 Transcript_10923/m.15619 type:complete len:146 (-) Transcript_10923:386-823(-)
MNTAVITTTANYLRRQLRRSCLMESGRSRATARTTSCRRAFFSTDDSETNEKTVYFHISPSGDWWTGPSIFAAKHLQPDYVKSIPIPTGFDPNRHFSEDEEDESESSGMSWEEKQQLLHQIYDEGKLPDYLLISSSKDKGKDSSY